MRNHVVDEITKLAEQDERIMLLTGDLGFGVLEKFAEKYPDRFVNTGIAEQNMTSVAAGLALEGNLVFTYSIGNFPTMRCLEQIRNDICYHNANVKILSLGGGFAYASLGMSHHATEDIAIMRSLPNMRVYVPADVHEALACLKEAYSCDGPAFIRMARGKEPDLHTSGNNICVKDLIKIKNMGKDINILTTGTVWSEGIALQECLEQKGLSVGLYSVPGIKPAAETSIKDLASNCKLIVTMEDHNVIGGLGSMVAEILSEMPNHAVLYRSGLRETYTSVVGNQDYLRDYYCLNAKKNMEIITDRFGYLFK